MQPVCNFHDFRRREFVIGVVYCGHFLQFKKFREEFFPLLKTNLRHLFMAYFLGKKTTKFSKWERERYFQDDIVSFIFLVCLHFYIFKSTFWKKKDGYSSLFHLARMVYGERLNLVHFLSVYYCVSSNNPIGFFRKLLSFVSFFLILKAQGYFWSFLFLDQGKKAVKNKNKIK